MFKITILPDNITIEAEEGESLQNALRRANKAPDAPCGGNGICHKCTVSIGGREILACQTQVLQDLTVWLPEKEKTEILSGGIFVSDKMNPYQDGYLAAIDIGTTTVVCYLLDKDTGAEIANASMLNPQEPFGADVVSRIQAAREGELSQMTQLIRAGITEILKEACEKASVLPEEIGVVSFVGNPCMQQLFLGIDTENLAKIPFAPKLTEIKTVPAKNYLPLCETALLEIVPDISGYVGADTVGCVLSTKLYEAGEMTLLVDIGTNGEMILGNKDGCVSCSTAAGPALEGARIKFGMRGAPGAIDHVKIIDGTIKCHVIGEGKATGICGSGLIDAVAAFLNLGLLNKRGRIQQENEIDGERVLPLTDGIYLTQNDIREVQLAKGAIRAGIELLAKEMGISANGIQKVLLAGAFGNFMDPGSACRIGLIPPEIEDRIIPVGNAAGSGAILMVRDQEQFKKIPLILKKIRFVELAELPDFQRAFGKYSSL